MDGPWLFEQGEEQVGQFLMSCPFKHRSKNERWLMLVAILLLEGVQDSLNEQTQSPSLPSRFRRKDARQLLVKPLTDNCIRQHIFIRKVQAQDPSLDLAPPRHPLVTRPSQPPFPFP